MKGQDDLSVPVAIKGVLWIYFSVGCFRQGGGHVGRSPFSKGVNQSGRFGRSMMIHMPLTLFSVNLVLSLGASSRPDPALDKTSLLLKNTTEAQKQLPRCSPLIGQPPCTPRGGCMQLLHVHLKN